MLKITLEGPMASGKTLTHAALVEIVEDISKKTGHEVKIVEILTDNNGMTISVGQTSTNGVFDRFSAAHDFSRRGRK